ncbi:MAG: hypothetical protein WAM46_15120, partial [Flavobacterium sp.]
VGEVSFSSSVAAEGKYITDPEVSGEIAPYKTKYSFFFFKNLNNFIYRIFLLNYLEKYFTFTTT